MDLSARRLALAWEGRLLGDPRYEILLDTLGGGQKLVATISTPRNTNNGFFGPSLVNGHLMFGGFNFAAPPEDYVARYSIAKGTLESAPIDGWLVSHASAGPRTFTVLGLASGAFQIEEQSQLSYSPGIPKEL